MHTAPRSIRLGLIILTLLLVAAPAADALAANSSDGAQAAAEPSVAKVDNKTLEIQFGNRIAAMRQRGGEPATSASPLGQQVHQVFGRLAQAARSRRGLPYTLSILSSSTPDAWSYPGGRVYITVGAINALDTYDELAGVLAHEIAHTALGHIFAQIRTDEGWAIIRSVADGNIAPTEENLGKYAVALLAKTYPSWAESEADSLARSFMMQAGYEASDLDTAYAKLAAATSGESFFRTHPHSGIQPYRRSSGERRGVPSSPGSTTEQPQTQTPPIAWQISGGAELVPLRTSEQQARLVYHDRGGAGGTGDDYELRLRQRSVSSVPSLYAGISISAGANWSVGAAGGILLNAQPFEGEAASSGGNAGYFEGGAYYTLLANAHTTGSIGILWRSVGISTRVGEVPRGSSTGLDYMRIGEAIVEAGQPIYASQSAGGPAVSARLEGGSGRFRWHVGGSYFTAKTPPYQYTTIDNQGRQVTIPFEGEPPSSFQIDGLWLQAGITTQF